MQCPAPRRQNAGDIDYSIPPPLTRDSVRPIPQTPKPPFDLEAANAACPIPCVFHRRSTAKDFHQTFQTTNKIMFVDDCDNEKSNFSYHTKKIRGLVEHYTRDSWPMDVKTPLLKSGDIRAYATHQSPHLLGDNLYDNYLVYVADETTHPSDDHCLHPLFGMILTADGKTVYIREFFVCGPCPPARLQASAEADAARLADAARRAKEEKEPISRRLRSAFCCVGAPEASRTVTGRIAEDLEIQKMVQGKNMKTLSLKTPIQKAKAPKMPAAPKRSKRVTFGTPLLEDFKGEVIQAVRA